MHRTASVATVSSWRAIQMDERQLISKFDLDRVSAHLLAGEVVAVPTDTVYGLSVALGVTRDTTSLFARKNRPRTIAVPVMVDGLSAALALCEEVSRTALSLVGKAFWPGALTLVVARDESCKFDLGGDQSTIGLRVPAHEGLRELCRLVGPLGVTSANLHTGQPCTSPAQLSKIFGSELVVLDGGVCEGAVSSVIDLTGETPVVLREGAVSLEMVLAVLG